MGMNINFFFIAVSSGLLMIFVFFKPLDIKKREFVDVPIFEVTTFSAYELDTNGLNDVVIGEKGIRYEDRYKFFNINYTDKTKEYVSNMKSDEGLYKGDIFEFSGHVSYFRDDGLNFKTQKIKYDKKHKIISTDTAFIAYMGKNKITGRSFIYNKRSKKIYSKNIKAVYQIPEDKK